LFARVRIAILPVGTGSSLVKILDGGSEILQHPWVVYVTYTMLFADTTYGRCNVRIPSGTHTREKVVFDLEVESTGETSRDESSIRRRSLHLSFEPANLFSILANRVGGVSVYFLKVVGKGKQNGQSQTRTNTHNHDVAKNIPGKSLILNGSNDVGINVQETQKDGILAALLDIIVFHNNTNFQRSTLSEIQDLNIEDGRQPISSQYSHVINCLEVVHEGTFGVIKRIIVEKKHGFSAKAIRVFLVVVGVRVVLKKNVKIIKVSVD
jgi:hypothetical protein